jgi:hypothetical protein
MCVRLQRGRPDCQYRRRPRRPFLFSSRKSEQEGAEDTEGNTENSKTF